MSAPFHRLRWFVSVGAILNAMLLAAEPPSKNAVEGASPQPKMRNRLGMEFVRLPPGRLTIGVMPEEAFLKEWNATGFFRRAELVALSPPQQSVEISANVMMATHEVTIGQFRQYIEATGALTEAEKDGRGGTGLTPEGAFEQRPAFTWRSYGFPVTADTAVANVSWRDAVAFCEWLTRTEGKIYRLPTEAEWECACRAGSTTIYSWGDNVEDEVRYGNGPDQSLGNTYRPLKWLLRGNDGFPYLAPVGQFKPNALGIYDLHGNVIEWCFDDYSMFLPATRLGIRDLPSVEPGSMRVHRGGNWFNNPATGGSGSRSGQSPAFRNSLTGFRIVLVDETPSK